MIRKLTLSIVPVFLLVFFSLLGKKSWAEEEAVMKIRWLGHACFLVESSEGTRIVTDPFDASIGYPVPSVEADLVTVSHNHFDHNAVGMLQGKPYVIKEMGVKKVKGIEFKGIKSYHDNKKGALRGGNIIFVFTVDGMRLCHLGDLGHLLTDEQLKEIGEVDILFIPVGGVYTIDAREAQEVTKQLNPKLVIPMHYKTEACTIGIGSCEAFSEGFETVERAKEWQGNKASLPAELTVLVLDYKD